MRFLRRRAAGRSALPWLVVALLLALALPPASFAQPAPPTLLVLKTASVAEAQPGQSFSYSIAVVNEGTAAVTLRDVLDPNLVLVSASSSPGITCQPGQTLVCTLAAGVAAGTVTLQVYARPTTPSGTVILNQASATSDGVTVTSATRSVRIFGAPVTPIPTATATPIPTWTPLPTRTPGPTVTPILPGTPEPTVPPGIPPSGLNCSPQALVRLPGVRAPNPQLNALAAASFAQVRQEIIARTGEDVLATLADVLRAELHHE